MFKIQSDFNINKVYLVFFTTVLKYYSIFYADTYYSLLDQQKTYFNGT